VKHDSFNSAMLCQCTRRGVGFEDGNSLDLRHSRSQKKWYGTGAASFLSFMSTLLKGRLGDSHKCISGKVRLQRRV